MSGASAALRSRRPERAPDLDAFLTCDSGATVGSPSTCSGPRGPHPATASSPTTCRSGRGAGRDWQISDDLGRRRAAPRSPSAPTRTGRRRYRAPDSRLLHGRLCALGSTCGPHPASALREPYTKSDLLPDPDAPEPHKAHAEHRPKRAVFPSLEFLPRAREVGYLRALERRIPASLGQLSGRPHAEGRDRGTERGMSSFHIHPTKPCQRLFILVTLSDICRSNVVPPAGFEPALPPPEGGALSPELRGRYLGNPSARPTADAATPHAREDRRERRATAVYTTVRRRSRRLTRRSTGIRAERTRR